MLLQTFSLTKQFGRRTALADVSLGVKPGELLGIVGPDGAGKTTLLRILAGAIGHSGGSIESKVRQDRIGYLSQHFSLYPDLTVWENLSFFGRIYGLDDQTVDRTGRYLLEWVGLWAFKDRIGSQLSGGMKQKLSLACALVHEADLMLLDEPTTAVDPVSRREFWELLQELIRKGTAVIVSTPYMDEAARCHQVAFLHEGRLLACDTPAALRQRMPCTVAEVRAPGLGRDALEQAALQLPGAQAAHPFGDCVHVTFSERLVNLPTRPGMTVTAVEPSLEDVYIWMLTREGVSA